MLNSYKFFSIWYFLQIIMINQLFFCETCFNKSRIFEFYNTLPYSVLLCFTFIWYILTCLLAFILEAADIVKPLHTLSSFRVVPNSHKCRKLLCAGRITGWFFRLRDDALPPLSTQISDYVSNHFFIYKKYYKNYFCSKNELNNYFIMKKIICKI